MRDERIGPELCGLLPGRRGSVVRPVQCRSRDDAAASQALPASWPGGAIALVLVCGERRPVADKTRCMAPEARVCRPGAGSGCEAFVKTLASPEMEGRRGEGGGRPPPS